MNDYKVNECWEADIMATYAKGPRRYFRTQGEIMLIRHKYLILEDFDGNGFMVLKKDFKPLKKVNRVDK